MQIRLVCLGFLFVSFRVFLAILSLISRTLMAAFNPGKAKLRYQLTFEGSWPTALAFLSNGKLAAANQLGHVFVWDLPDKPPAFKAEPKGERQAPNVWPARR